MKLREDLTIAQCIASALCLMWTIRLILDPTLETASAGLPDYRGHSLLLPTLYAANAANENRGTVSVR